MEEKKAFVIMPFAEEFNEIYSHLIKGALEKAGFISIRADDIKSQNNILKDIIEGIVECHLIIADLTGSNPNVYYELGIAHALDKNVILLTQNISDLPFDLRSYKVIRYGNDFRIMKQAEEELTELAKNAFVGKVPFGNPVKDFAGSERKINPIVIVKKDENIKHDDIDNENLGLLDYRIMFESGIGKMTDIVGEVSSRMTEELTPNIVKCTKELNENQGSAEKQKEMIQNLAGCQDNYVTFLRPKNIAYKTALNELETGLEGMLTGDFNMNEHATPLKELLDDLSGTEKAAIGGRDSFAGLIQSIESTPKIEQNYNHSKQRLAAELNSFVQNTDQLLAIISRSRRIGSHLFEKA